MQARRADVSCRLQPLQKTPTASHSGGEASNCSSSGFYVFYMPRNDSSHCGKKTNAGTFLCDSVRFHVVCQAFFMKFVCLSLLGSEDRMAFLSQVIPVYFLDVKTKNICYVIPFTSIKNAKTIYLS